MAAGEPQSSGKVDAGDDCGDDDNCDDEVGDELSASTAVDAVNSSLRNCHRWMCCDEDVAVATFGGEAPREDGCGDEKAAATVVSKLQSTSSGPSVAGVVGCSVAATVAAKSSRSIVVVVAASPVLLLQLLSPLLLVSIAVSSSAAAAIIMAVINKRS